jgi:adenosine deaminase
MSLPPSSSTLTEEHHHYLASFVSSLPKIEVHAHLNGSLPAKTVQELIELATKDGENQDLLEFRIPDELESIESYVMRTEP